MRVLVVSENAGERDRATAALRARPDVEITEATSATEAHHRLQDEEFDVVVMDGDMRPEGGYSVLYEARATAQLRGEKLPASIVLMARADDRWLSKWAGATEALVKPVDSFVLAERVQALYDVTGGEVPSETPGQTVGVPLEGDVPPELQEVEAPRVTDLISRGDRG